MEADINKTPLPMNLSSLDHRSFVQLTNTIDYAQNNNNKAAYKDSQIDTCVAFAVPPSAPSSSPSFMLAAHSVLNPRR